MISEKEIILVDMDDTLVDFHSHPEFKIPRDSYNHSNMYKDGYFKHLEPLPGAIEYIKALIEMEDYYDVWICTQPVAGLSCSYSDKAEWIKKYLPELEKKIIMTQDKTLQIGDWLIDDNAKWRTFKGRFIHFKTSLNSKSQWKDIYTFFNFRRIYGL